jgi:pyruvate dehydrogenase E1 component alpha subunit
MKVPELLATGKLPGFYHLAVGQEAIQMAIYLEKEAGDWLSPHPRCHPLYALTCGINDFTTEMIGRKSSLCEGVASYVHIFSPENHICPSNGLMGENQAIGAGFGLAMTEFDDTDGCLILGIGDGTLEEGAVNEVMNVIASRNLKVCMIIENNDITISTRKHDVSRLKDREKGLMASVFRLYLAMAMIFLKRENSSVSGLKKREEASRMSFR